MELFFILGSNPDLSVLEIYSVCKRFSIHLEIKQYYNNVLIVFVDTQNPEKLFSSLGGSIKYGKVHSFQEGRTIEENTIFETFVQPLLSFEQKLFVGTSFYSLDESFTKKKLIQEKKNFLRLILSLKKQLKQENIPFRYVSNNDIALSSVLVQKNKLLSKRGVEIDLLYTQEGIYFCETLGIQDFELFNTFDYKRPGIDAKSGMLPPKLSLMMVNFLSLSSEEFLYDAFCGSGTNIMMALFSGHKNIIGSDISQKAINDSKKNLVWLSERFNYETKDVTCFKHDITKFPQDVKSVKIGGIVSEPFLGPPIRGDIKKYPIAKTVKELSELYIKTFQIFAKILQKDATVIFVMPSFKIGKNVYTINILDAIQGYGFGIEKPLEHILKYTQRGSLIYKRESSKIHREIFIFKKK